jgi:hypothetical protein
MDLPQSILHTDYSLMLKVNRDWTAPWFDTVAIFIREGSFWAPFYLFLLIFINVYGVYYVYLVTHYRGRGNPGLHSF